MCLKREIKDLESKDYPPYMNKYMPVETFMEKYPTIYKKIKEEELIRLKSFMFCKIKRVNLDSGMSIDSLVRFFYVH